MADLEEIIAAAAKVFQRKGYHAATVQDIADAVGILKGNIAFRIPAFVHRIFVTPEAHRIHHSIDATQGNSNYSTIKTPFREDSSASSYHHSRLIAWPAARRPAAATRTPRSR